MTLVFYSWHNPQRKVTIKYFFSVFLIFFFFYISGRWTCYEIRRWPCLWCGKSCLPQAGRDKVLWTGLFRTVSVLYYNSITLKFLRSCLEVSTKQITQLSLAVHSPEKSFWGLIFFLANKWANKVPFDLGTCFYFGVFPQFFCYTIGKKCLQIL